MAKLAEILPQDELRNYRTVRVGAGLLIILGLMQTTAGCLFALMIGQRLFNPAHRELAAVTIAVLIVGPMAVISGIGTLSGSRRWSRPAYVVSAIYFFLFPVGTIASVIMFMGLSKYLTSVQKVKTAEM